MRMTLLSKAHKTSSNMKTVITAHERMKNFNIFKGEYTEHTLPERAPT